MTQRRFSALWCSGDYPISNAGQLVRPYSVLQCGVQALGRAREDPFAVAGGQKSETFLCDLQELAQAAFRSREVGAPGESRGAETRHQPTEETLRRRFTAARTLKHTRREFQIDVGMGGKTPERRRGFIGWSVFELWPRAMIEDHHQLRKPRQHREQFRNGFCRHLQ